MTAQRLHSGSFLGFIESYKVIPKRKILWILCLLWGFRGAFAWDEVLNPGNCPNLRTLNIGVINNCQYCFGGFLIIKWAPKTLF